MLLTVIDALLQPVPLEEGVGPCETVCRGELVGALAEATAVTEATNDGEKGAVKLCAELGELFRETVGD